MPDYDYIVVGSGAGGGPLAANLARTGFTVLVIEAGGDPCAADERGRLLYQVPIFHGLASEAPACSWNYYVRHHDDDRIERGNSKYDLKGGGTWYPRGGTLGGSTALNAMITVTPQALDWNGIAALTGDDSWRAEHMQKYFARLEDARYVPRPGSLLYTITQAAERIDSFLRGRAPVDPRHGHGFGGWLTTSEADPRVVIPDRSLRKLMWNAVTFAAENRIGSWLARALTRFDPNDIRNSSTSPEGLAFTPLATANGRRTGPREYLLRTQEQHPKNLTIKLNTLVTRVLFEGRRTIGVEVLEGAHLYEADPRARPGGTGSDRPPPRAIRARREVILAAGAFNTPQILKLSGVGPAAELARHGIGPVADRPGVGENLQDRYEMCVVSSLRNAFSSFESATFAPPETGAAGDGFLRLWKEGGRGIYASNGAMLGFLKRSSPELPEPDLYIFGLPVDFRGHKRGYSGELERYRNRFTWAILKAYTRNRAGRVTLKSADPTRSPNIDFRSFCRDDAASRAGAEADLDALVQGVELVRALNRRLGDAVKAEVYPGPGHDTPEKLRAFIEQEAWGHHASGSCRIGPEGDPLAVVDSRFRVLGVDGLRVVDASVFPNIPGYFIAAAIYMISEKASDIITEDARRNPTL